MRTICNIIILILAVCLPKAYGQPVTIINDDGTPLATRYCHNDISYPIKGQPAGGIFSGAGITQQDGRIYFNPVLASQGISVFPYATTIQYTVNNNTANRQLLIYKPVVISPPLKDTATCNGRFVLDAKTLYAGAYNYQWTPGQYLDRSDTSYTEGLITATQTFVLVAEDVTSGCTGSDTVIVNQSPVPVLTISNDTTILSRQKVQLWAEGAEEYLWQPSKWLDSDTIARPVTHPWAPISYMVIGSNAYGCRDTATVTIDIMETMFVPNAFSPNGDGINDVFKVENIGYQGIAAFRIFNRWGQLIYETLDGTKGWNGEYKGIPADAGTYYYFIKLNPLEGDGITFKGEVQLLR